MYALSGTKRNALLEVIETGFGVFVKSWITNNSDDDFILKQYCPPGFLFYSAPRGIKRGGGICFFTDVISIWKILKSLPLNFWNAVMPETVGATTYFVIAVYRPPGLNVKFFIDHFTILFEERLHVDKIVFLGDF